MKRLILLAFILVFTGCNQATDTATPDQDTSTTSLNVTAKALPADGSKTADSQAGGIKAQVFQFGIYKTIKKGQIKNSTETNTGKVVYKPTLEHVRMSDRIPLARETYFGFQYRLWNLPPEAMIKPVLPLRTVLIHPEMTLPDGSKTSGWDRMVKGRVQTQQVLGFDGYGFNEDYELVEGDWIFQVWYQDKKLIERKFVSVRASQEQSAGTVEKE